MLLEAPVHSVSIFRLYPIDFTCDTLPYDIDEVRLGTFGARLFSPSTRSESIGWIIRAGHDFPLSARVKLEAWRANLLVLEEENSRSTRACLAYEDESGDSRSQQSMASIPI